MRLLVFIIILYLPVSAYAAVTINEIAWMGNSNSANDEWIELYNTGNSDVLLDEWTLTDGVNLEISLSGTIGAGQYAVLERTDETSALGTAFLIYTGALSNTGATLVLYRPDGMVEDQVASGENWENIGGDNSTKETAQYTTSGWITAEATPGKNNAKAGLSEGSDNVQNNEGDDNVLKALVSDKRERKRISSKVAKLEIPDAALSLLVDSPDIVYVNQPVLFSVNTSGLGKVILNSLVYQWNFGDLSTSSQKEPVHVFSYPGEYVVTVYAEYAYYKQIARKKITVLPVSFSITSNSLGDIQVNNNAKYETNISGYVIEGNTQLTFPDNSIILANGTITIPKEKLDVLTDSSIKLFDKVGALVAKLDVSATVKDLKENQVVEPTSVIRHNPQAPKSKLPDNFSFSDTEADTEESDIKVTQNTSSKQQISTQSATTNGSSQKIPREAIPLLGLLSIIALGIFGVYFGKGKHT